MIDCDANIEHTDSGHCGHGCERSSREWTAQPCERDQVAIGPRSRSLKSRVDSTSTGSWVQVVSQLLRLGGAQRQYCIKLDASVVLAG